MGWQWRIDVRPVLLPKTLVSHNVGSVTFQACSSLFLQAALTLYLRDDLGSQYLSASSQPFRWRRLGLKTGEESLQFWSLSRRLMHWNIGGQAVIQKRSMGAST
jgi:hypothetical protein